MPNFVQNVILPFSLFVGAIGLIGCDQVSAPASHTVEPEVPVASTSTEQETSNQNIERSSGNMFYIVRDVADLQLKASTYVETLQQTQTDIQTAIDAKDANQLQVAATQLQQQLTGFNQALDSLSLKSAEIETIRSNIKQANDQVLNSPFLNGQVDLSKVDFSKIQQQMGNVQNEMLKLAGMLLQGDTTEVSSQGDLNESDS